MSNWQEMHERARALIEEGLKILKSGASDAEIIAGATANAAKLHVNIKKNQVTRLKLVHELGNYFYTATKGLPATAETMVIPKKMKEIVKQIRTLDKEIEKYSSKLGKFSVVTKKEEKRPPVQR